MYCIQRMGEIFCFHLTRIRKTWLRKIKCREWSNWHWDADVTCSCGRSHQNTFLGKNPSRLSFWALLWWHCLKSPKVPEGSKARSKMISLEMGTVNFLHQRLCPGVLQESSSRAALGRMSVMVKDVSRGWPWAQLKPAPASLEMQLVGVFLWKYLHIIHLQTSFWCSWDSRAEQSLCPLGLTICIRKGRFNQERVCLWQRMMDGAPPLTLTGISLGWALCLERRDGEHPALCVWGEILHFTLECIIS